MPIANRTSPAPFERWAATQASSPAVDITTDHDRACVAAARAYALAQAKQLERARLMVAGAPVDQKVDVYIAILLAAKPASADAAGPKQPGWAPLLSPPACRH